MTTPRQHAGTLRLLRSRSGAPRDSLVLSLSVEDHKQEERAFEAGAQPEGGGCREGHVLERVRKSLERGVR